MLVRAVLLAVAIAAPAAVASDVWRWVDSQGRVHYSDTPVQGAVLVKRSSMPRGFATSAAPTAAQGAPPPAASPRPAAAPTESISERLAREQAARQIQSDVAKTQAEQCKAATQVYEQQIAARRMVRKGPNGEQVFLSEAEIAESRMQALRDRDLACGTAARR